MSARAGRSRFFIGIASLILMIGFVAIFHSSQQQLDESRQSRLRCEQQQEALNSRLQAIIEHKFRVEKALENERREHLATRQHFEQKSKEQKDLHNKATMELNVRFESLQQHYKLLQSEHNDLVEDCTKTKETYLEQINGLERKVKSLQSQYQQSKNQHNKDIEQWKVKYNNLEHEKQRIEILLRAANSKNDYAIQRYKRDNENLEKLIIEYKTHCEYQPQTIQHQQQHDEQLDSNLPLSGSENQVKKGNVIERNFNEQQVISNNLYKIPIKITNNTKHNVNRNRNYNNNKNNNMLHETTNNKNLDIDWKRNNIIGINGSSTFNLNNNNNNNYNINDNNANNRQSNGAGAVINSVENFQIAPNLLVNSNDDTNNEHKMNNDNNNNNNKQVLQQPPPLNAPVKSSTASSPLKTPDNKSNRPEALYASIANPTSEKNKRSSTVANDRKKESGGRLKSRPIPIGVAPVPENFEVLIKNDEMNQSENINNNNDDNNNNHNNNNNSNNNNNNNNRYANVIDELSGKKDDPEQDNGANEVKDDFNIGGDEIKNDDTKDHLREVLDNINNAAEEDTNNFIDSKGLGGAGIGGGGAGVGGGSNKLKKDNDEDVDVLGNNQKDKADNVLEGEDKLMNEVVGDQGKEVAFPDGMHVEEANEEDEDEDEYSNLAARQQEGHAIRN